MAAFDGGGLSENAIPRQIGAQIVPQSDAHNVTTQVQGTTHLSAQSQYGAKYGA
jgi:hypothetical protein